MYNSNPIAMESNKKTKPKLGSYWLNANRDIKVVDLYKEPNALIERRKRKLTLPKGASLARIKEIQKSYLQNSYWGASKRIFDIAASLFVVVFMLSWVYPLLLILIKRESKGPIIFKQKRNGLDQEPFDCYKFRSMTLNDYADTVPTIHNDPRITRVGCFIRKYSIDELPQFINVLKGDMTVVGPRPHMLSETDDFVKISADFYKRHHVKPGITGLAQINNCRGEINNYNDLSNRIKYDLFYIKNASMVYDIKIIYWTFIKMIFGDSKAK